MFWFVVFLLIALVWVAAFRDLRRKNRDPLVAASRKTSWLAVHSLATSVLGNGIVLALSLHLLLRDTRPPQDWEAFVLFIVALGVCGATVVISSAAGVIGLVLIRRSGGALRGWWIAIAGITSGILSLLVWWGCVLLAGYHGRT
jgi:hypothetical protein